MAKGMREIKQKIKSVKNTAKITKAMKMVAAAKLKKASDHAESARPYTKAITNMVEEVASVMSDGILHPMLASRPCKRVGYLIITSDKGLAGGFNSNLVRKFLATLAEKHKNPDEYIVFVIGRKGISSLNHAGVAIANSFKGLHDAPSFSDVDEITNMAVNGFTDGTYDELYLVFNQFKNALVQIPAIMRVLPIEKPVKHKENAGTMTEFYPNPASVLDVLLPRYAQTVIYSAMLESKASEFGARMTAMGAATENANDLISKLTLSYNRARQAAITQEIVEVIAGVGNG